MMIDYDGYVSLDRKDDLPDESVIYFVIEHEKVMYIGRSDCISNRFKSHHKLDEFMALDNPKVYWIKIPPEQLKEKEKYYINKFNPDLNDTPMPGVKYPSQIKNSKSIRLVPQTHAALKALALEWDMTIGATVKALVQFAREGELRPLVVLEKRAK